MKDGYLKEEDTAILRSALLRAQEVMAGVFGASFSKVFENFIDAIQDTYRSYDGEFLRFLIEEVLYRYGNLMSEPWSKSLKEDYGLNDIHSPGNAADLLTILVKSIIPKKENQAAFLRKTSLSINRNSKVGISDKAIPATTKPNDKDKAAKATKNKRKKDKKVASKIAPNHSTNSKPSEIYCLKN